MTQKKENQMDKSMENIIEAVFLYEVYRDSRHVETLGGFPK